MASTTSEQSDFAPCAACEPPSNPRQYGDPECSSEGGVEDLDAPIGGLATVPDMVKRARDRYTERREIDRVFGLEGFAVSSCWDIMLRFYDVEASGQMIRLPLVSGREHSPPTTCLRWLKVLVQMALIEQKSAPQGEDENLYQLTPAGRAATEKALLIGL